MNQTIEQQVINIIQDILHDLGLEIVRVVLRGDSIKTLEILIDKPDDSMVSIADCKKASQNIAALLDVEDIIPTKYYLEVSSAGVERPLMKFADYVRFVGREAKIKLKQSLNGKIRYSGTIIKAENDDVHLNLKDEVVILPFDSIKHASLVLTDEMFRKLLNK